jgi:hypothetical protein
MRMETWNKAPCYGHFTCQKDVGWALDPSYLAFEIP